MTTKKIPCAQNSIFISHVNDDPAAENILHGLVGAIPEAFASRQHGYQVVFDREDICPGEIWRHRIYAWLWDCPAAVILISPHAFRAGKPWVAAEAFFLSVRHHHGAITALIPVVIGNVREQLEKTEVFKPSDILRFKHVVCEEPGDSVILEETIQKVVAILRGHNLPPTDLDNLTGLAKALASLLSEPSHSAALGAMAAAIGLRVAATPGAVAQAMLAAPNGPLVKSLWAFMQAPGEIHESKLKTLRRLRDLLSAREVPEAAARALAAEMARPADEARAVVLDTWQDDITRLYFRRALAADNIPLTLLHAGQTVLELSALDTARQGMEAMLLKEFAPDIDDPEDARARSDAGTRFWRSTGSPAVICINVDENLAFKPIITAARTVAPHCGLLLRTKRKLPPEACCAPGDVYLLRPALADGTRQTLDSIIAGLSNFCRQMEAYG